MSDITLGAMQTLPLNLPRTTVLMRRYHFLINEEIGIRDSKQCTQGHAASTEGLKPRSVYQKSSGPPNDTEIMGARSRHKKS